MGADLEAEGGDGFEKRRRSPGEVHAAGGEFAAGGMALAEAIKPAAQVAGIGCRGHFGLPGVVIRRNGAGRLQQLGQDVFVGTVGGGNSEEGRRGQRARIRGPRRFDFEEMAELAVALAGAIEEAFQRISGDVGRQEIHGAGQGRGAGGLAFPDIQPGGAEGMAFEGIEKRIGIGDFAGRC